MITFKYFETKEPDENRTLYRSVKITSHYDHQIAAFGINLGSFYSHELMRRI